MPPIEHKKREYNLIIIADDKSDLLYVRLPIIIFRLYKRKKNDKGNIYVYVQTRKNEKK